MSTWGRDKFTSGWNNPGHFQYDSADLPFSGEAGYLESGMPLWKINSITEMEKSFCGGPDNTSSAKDQLVSPLVKISSANSKSQENVSSDGLAALPQQRQLSADEKRRLSQSLPATPLSTPLATPYSTPAQTPYSTPAPTPQSSPMLQRKTEMDAVCKAAARCNQRLAGEQPPQNIKWFYLGFLAQPSAVGVDQSKQLSNCKDSIAGADSSRSVDAVRINQTAAKSESMQRPYLRRCAPLMSNRDMNFLAPTSM